MRILIGAVVAGVVVFLWGFVSHVVLPLGEMGIRVLPNEDDVISSLRESIPEPGLYFFPGLSMRSHPTEEQQAAWQAKYEAGPTGFLVYHPTGEKAMSPTQLAGELVSNIVAALIAGFVLSFVGASFGTRAFVVALLGLFAWFSISVSYWNWYRFPTEFVAAEALDQFVGWLLGGLALAAIVPPTRA